jgi:spore germination protein GerM
VTIAIRPEDRDPMTVRRYGLIAALLICIGATGWLVYRYLARESAGPAEVTEKALRRMIPKVTKSTVHLYFADMDHGHLKAETRSVALPDAAVDRAKAMIHGLIEGSGDALTRTLPEETKLLALYLDKEGVAYVNFNKAFSDKHPGGSLTELLSIYSVVNTLSLNIPDIEAVKFLIEGREAKTLAGHIDLRYAFRPDLLIIK